MSNNSTIRKEYNCFLLFTLIFMGFDGYGQISNQVMENRISPDTAQQLAFRLGVAGFVKNNEYFNDLRQGYTLWGVQLNPSLVYRISEKAVVQGGLFWRNDFGEDHSNKPEATFTFKFSNKSWNYLFGSIEGNVSHRLVEPLYNFERYLLTPVENGLQINHWGKKHFFDFWITYPQNTLPGYARQEQFWGGVSTLINVLDRNKIKADLIGQTTVFHAGGQGITAGLPVRTALNAALGGRLERKYGSWVRSLRIEPYWLFYSQSAAESNQGHAWYLNAALDTRAVQLMISYWNGRNYNSDFGGDLFVSASRNISNPAGYQADREWIMMRVIKEILLAPGLSLNMRFEPYADLKSGKFEHAEGIYLIYTLKEKLLSVRK